MGKQLKRWQVLEQKIKANKWTTGIEVGVWDGSTFFYLLHNTPSLRLIGVDQWSTYEGFGDKATTGYKDYSAVADDLEIHRHNVIEKVEKMGTSRAKIFEMPSLDAAEYIGDGSLDFVFIDADHRTSFVRADIAAWSPKIRSGGSLFGHDWHIASVQIALYGKKATLLNDDHVWEIKL